MIGRFRASTVVLALIFVVTLALYLVVRPGPAPAVQYVPAVPVTTTGPPATTATTHATTTTNG